MGSAPGSTGRAGASASVLSLGLVESHVLDDDLAGPDAHVAVERRVIEHPLHVLPGPGPLLPERGLTAHDGAHAVAFVLPADLPADQAPAPSDDSLVVRPMASTTTAAITYSGRWTQDSYDRHCAMLLDAVAREGLVAVGEPRFARYNAPFTPWFLRRNEVLVDIASGH